MKVLALDLAHLTGWALWEDGRLLDSGFHRFGKAKANAWQRIEAARLWLPEALSHVAWGRGQVAKEDTIGRFHNATRSAAHLEAALFYACQSLGVLERDVFGYSPTEIKKAATGSGAASKGDVIEAMSARWGIPALSDDNEADALAVLHLHLLRGES